MASDSSTVMLVASDVMLLATLREIVAGRNCSALPLPGAKELQGA